MKYHLIRPAIKPRLLLCWLAILAGLLSPRALAVGTWTALANASPGPQINNMLLMPDGTVLAHDVNSATHWYKLTPDATGSYIKGTWSSVASMNYSREYFASQVLTDGRVFVAGGEYGNGGTNGEFFDPTANKWTMAPNTPNYNNFLDACSEIMPNGNVLISPVSPATYGGTLIWNAANNTWTIGPTLYRGSDQDEACWVKLPDDSWLTVDPFGQNTERYIPSQNKWINDTPVPVPLYGWGGEMGAGFLLPNGNVFYLSASNNTAIYTPSGTTTPGTWQVGANIPNDYGVIDGPGAMMANGKILCCVGTNGSYDGPSYFYEYDYAANAFTAAPSPTSTTPGASFSPAPFVNAMLVLPDGSVLLSRQSSRLYVYTPDGSPLPSGKPAINSVSVNPDGSLHLTGTLFNGISEGASYGDDLQMNSNYPLVRMTNSAGQIFYGRTFNWSSTSVMTGTNVVTTEVFMPANLAAGTYSMVVVANGNSSDPVSITYPLAGPLLWDANTATSGAQDGSGTWSSAGANWWNGTDMIWNDTAPAYAIFGNGGTGGTVTVSGAHTNTWVTFNTVNGAYTLSGSGSLTISNGIIANDSANVNVPVNLADDQTWQVALNQILAVGGVINGNQALLLNGGSGTLTLSGANTFTGGLTISNGTLQLGNAGATGNAGTGVITLARGSAGLDGANAALAVNETGTPVFTNGVVLAAGNQGVYLNASRTAVFSGNISGPGQLWADGPGTLVLSNTANSFSGGTVLASSALGALQIDSFAELGTGNVYFNAAGGTLIYAGGSTTTTAKLGTTLFQGGTSVINILNSATTLTNATAMTGTGTFVKSGPGTLALSAANTYTANTVISNGVLALIGSGLFTSSTNIIINSGATLDVHARTATLLVGASQILTANGATGILNGNISLGTGALSLNYNGTQPSLTIINGTLMLGSGQVKVTTSSVLPVGTYKLISKQTGGTVVGVTGNSKLVIGGSGLVLGETASLQIIGGELYLNVQTPNPGQIGWGPAKTISADTDIWTVGTSVYAYDWANTNQTVNGLNFVGANTTSGASTNVTFAASTGSVVNNTAIFTGGTATPYANLSAAYQDILDGADYAGSANATFTVTLRNLVVGRTYGVQVWVNDSRSGSTTARNETVSSGTGNAASLAYNVQQAGGGVGQYVIGLFMASATNQTFTVLGAASTQINALQVRDITGTSSALPPPAPYWGGFVNNNWDDATTNWGTGQAFGLVKTYFTNNLATNVYFADTNIYGNPVINNLINVQAAGESFNAVTFANNSVNYTVQNVTGAIGITGSTKLIKNGSGIVTLVSANTYTGPTTINAGTLSVNGSIGTNNVTVQSGATLGGVGIINGSVTVSGSVSPASSNSVGTLTTGSETWNGAGTYIFGLNNATNPAGGDLLSVNGAINVQAGSNPFIIQLISLAANNTAGPVDGFLSYTNYYWPIAQTTGGIQNFNASAFSINTNGFGNPTHGSFSLITNNNALILVYTALPLVVPTLSSVPTYAAGTFGLTFSGPNGQSYRVLASTNLIAPLADWTVLTNGVFGAGVANFSDPSATNGEEFYRVASP